MSTPEHPSAALAIRDATDADADGLIALIGAIFAEYPGCILDVDRESPELRAVATHFRRAGGRFWVAASGGEILGCVGFKSAMAGHGLELCKLYVGKRARRRGLGGALCGLVEAEARACGATFVELWSDTRFEDAHRLYERRGYVRGRETRDLHDLSNTTEYYFRVRLDLTP